MTSKYKSAIYRKVKNFEVSSKFKKAIKRSEAVSIQTIDMGAGLFLASDKYYVSTKIGMCGCPRG